MLNVSARVDSVPDTPRKASLFELARADLPQESRGDLDAMPEVSEDPRAQRLVAGRWCTRGRLETRRLPT